MIGLCCKVFGKQNDNRSGVFEAFKLKNKAWAIKIKMADTRRRVKLYVLNDERQWDDRGTGHVTSCYVDRLGGMSLLVRSETDGAVLLESKIQPTGTAYQKQQETLIVWSENDSYDLALSFQERAGCDEIWEIICQVHGKDPSVDVTQDIIQEEMEEQHLERLEQLEQEMPEVVSPIELPPCELSKLDTISELFCSILNSPIGREKLAIAIEEENYIRKLTELFHMCEDLENMDGLHHLYEIIKCTILLNKNSLLEIMFSDDLIYDIVGCLEYDPSVLSAHRHREYLNSTANFREVIPIQNHELLNKIHQTYRVQYIQDVIMPTLSVFEDNVLTCLSSFIFFNKLEIVNMIQEDDRFLPELFAQLTDENTEDSKRRDLMLFLKEFCNFAQTQQNKDGFFKYKHKQWDFDLVTTASWAEHFLKFHRHWKTLSNLGILPALEVVLSMDDVEVRQAAIDIFAYIVEFSPSMVWEFIMQEINTQDDDGLLINVLIEQMICDTDPDLGVAMQLMNILRILMDPENMMATVAVSNIPKTETTEFLSLFYKHCMHILTAPLLANTSDDKPSKDDFQTSQLLSLILELLTFTVEHHSYHIKNYIVNKDLLRRVLILLKSRHQFLVLCAVRFFRKIIAMKDEFFNRYIMRGNLVEPVIRTFKNNGNKYNLLNSALIELFEFIKLDDIRMLIIHIVETHGQFLDGVDYVSTFKDIKIKYDQIMDKRNSWPGESLRQNTILQNSRFRSDARTMDEEEELYFEEEDECEDGDGLLVGDTAFHTAKVDTELDSIGRFFDHKKVSVVASDSPGSLLNKDATESTSTSAMLTTTTSSSSTATTLSSDGRPAGSPIQQQVNNKTLPVQTSSPVRPSSPPISGGAPSPGKKANVSEVDSTITKAASPTSASGIKTNSVVAKGGIVGLVDYDEDSDDDEDEEEELPPTKRPRLTS